MGKVRVSNENNSILFESDSEEARVNANQVSSIKWSKPNGPNLVAFFGSVLIILMGVGLMLSSISALQLIGAVSFSTGLVIVVYILLQSESITVTLLMKSGEEIKFQVVEEDIETLKSIHRFYNRQ